MANLTFVVHSNCGISPRRPVAALALCEARTPREELHARFVIGTVKFAVRKGRQNPLHVPNTRRFAPQAIMSNSSSADTSRQEDWLCSIDVRRWMRTEFAHITSTQVSEPYEVNCFSRNADRSVDYGSRHQLRQFCEPRLNVDLGEGIETFREKKDDMDGVAPVIKCLQCAGFDIENEADVVSYRNNLNKIALTPYNTRDPYELDAVKVGRTVFLDIRKVEEGPVDARHRRFIYMGYHFEAFCTGQSPDVPVDANEEFGVAMRIKIAQHRVILGCEIDAEFPSSGSSTRNNYIELKTTKKPISQRDFDVLYADKYLKWFVQSYLGGVRSIFVGLRDNSGRLADVQHLSTLSLSRLAREGLRSGDGGRHNSTRRQLHHTLWEPFVCINFVDHVLSLVRRHCDENPGQTLRFSYDPGSRILRGRRLSVNEGVLELADRIRVTLGSS